jgi:DNA modification methylase
MRTEIIWYKQNIRKRTAWGSWRSPFNPHILPSWEYVMIFHKRDWKLRGDRKKADITAKEFLKCSDGFWKIQPETRRKDHPAPFPEELVYRLIKFYTYRDNVVLDAFGGTGIVALVALKTGRHFIHIDISKKYCWRTHARLKAYLSSERVRKRPSLVNFKLAKIVYH